MKVLVLRVILAYCVMGKISRKINFLAKISNYVSVFTKSLLYKSIVLLYVNFCAAVLYSLPQNVAQKLQELQNRAMRIILKCNRYIPIVHTYVRNIREEFF